MGKIRLLIYSGMVCFLAILTVVLGQNRANRPTNLRMQEVMR